MAWCWNQGACKGTCRRFQSHKKAHTRGGSSALEISSSAWMSSNTTHWTQLMYWMSKANHIISLTLLAHDYISYVRDCNSGHFSICTEQQFCHQAALQKATCRSLIKKKRTSQDNVRRFKRNLIMFEVMPRDLFVSQTFHYIKSSHKSIRKSF